MPTITLTLSDAQGRYVEEQIRAGEYHDASEYFRDLIRADQKRSARQALEESLLSAVAESNAEEPTPKQWEHHHHSHALNPPRKS